MLRGLVLGFLSLLGAASLATAEVPAFPSEFQVQGRRNASAAKRFFKRLLVSLKYKPKRLVTDSLRSYGAAKREVLPGVRHRISHYLNN